MYQISDKASSSSFHLASVTPIYKQSGTYST